MKAAGLRSERTAPLRLRETLPDPARLWIRWTPARWPAPSTRWIDVAQNRLVDAEAPASAEAIEPLLPAPPAYDDVVGLPPTAVAWRARRDALVDGLVSAGAPIVAQRLPGEAKGAESLSLYDLTEPLLAGDAEALADVPAGAWALWPLIPGRTDTAELIGPGLQVLATAGVQGVLSAVVELAPRQRRLLAEEGDEEAFAALFHGQAADERDFHQRVVTHGLGVFPPRPLPAAPGVAGNRRLAALLFRIGDLSRRLRRPVGRSEILWAAARNIDRCEHDLERLAREGDLGIVIWLDAETREILEAFARDGRSPILEDLEREYLSADRPGARGGR
ncbi:MAG: hypothetical protein ACRD2Z_04810 [Thermoanaerobaculia bacterium]